MKIASDHGFPKGSMPDDDAFDRFKNERDYVAQSGQMKTTVAAMDWAAAEIERLRKGIQDYLDGNYASPRDGRTVSSQTKCPHGMFYWEACENCIDEHFSALLKNELSRNANESGTGQVVLSK